jgi:hypothetical protein
MLYSNDNEYVKIFYDNLIKRLQKLGYIGFRYNGGYFSGTEKHNAYVFWDIDLLERIK